MKYASDPEYRERIIKKVKEYAYGPGKEILLKWRREYIKTPERRLAKARWNHSDRGRKLIKDGHKRRYRSPEAREKQIVRAICNDAIKAGVISRRPCEVCGSIKTEMHHEEYRRLKALSGRWLCRGCHAAEHKRLRNSGISVVVIFEK